MTTGQGPAQSSITLLAGTFRCTNQQLHMEVPVILLEKDRVAEGNEARVRAPACAVARAREARNLRQAPRWNI